MKPLIGRSPVRAGLMTLLAVLALTSALAFAPLVGGAAQLKLPTGVSRDLAYQMYGEQVDSADTIRELIDGEVSRFDVLDSDVSSTTASLDVRVTYKNGTTRRGVMNLAKGNGSWYFESITRTGYVRGPGYEDTPDIGVLNTMLSEQTKHSDVTALLVDGGFSKVTVGTPKKGFRSTRIPITLSGTAKTTKAQITAVKRTQDGRAQWFVASFK